jgi:hypothetical protein
VNGLYQKAGNRIMASRTLVPVSNKSRLLRRKSASY